MKKASNGQNWVERHSVNCYFCGVLFDERQGQNADTYNNNDGGTICPDCLKLKTERDSMEKVTGRPWVYFIDEQSGESFNIIPAKLAHTDWSESNKIAEVTTEANAALIVRAVNSHEALIEALKAFVDFSYKSFTSREAGDKEALRVRQVGLNVISRAEGRA